MRATLLLLAFLGTGASACSSSSRVGVPDSAPVEDSSKPTHDASHDGGLADARHRSDGRAADATNEAAAGEAGDEDVSTAEAGVDAAGCSGLDAAISGLTIQPACEACIAATCCSQALACAATAGCKDIEACATKCVAMGTAGMTCAVTCIEGDSGVPEGGQLNPAQSAARTLDLCFVTMCSSVCGV